MLCPRCDFQGRIRSVRIRATGEIVHLCDECDAVWETLEDIECRRFEDFAAFMSRRQLKGIWSEVEIVDSGEG